MKPMLVIALLFACALPGCMGGGEGTLVVEATDGPGAIDEFSSLIVTVPTIKVHEAGGSGEGDSEGNETGDGWHTFDVDASRQQFDLVDLLDGNTTELLNESLAAGHYTQIRLMASSATGTLKSGESVTVRVPNGSLKIVKSFDVADDKETTFVADINVVKEGTEYKLTPVIGKSMVEGPE